MAAAPDTSLSTCKPEKVPDTKITSGDLFTDMFNSIWSRSGDVSPKLLSKKARAFLSYTSWAQELWTAFEKYAEKESAAEGCKFYDELIKLYPKWSADKAQELADETEKASKASHRKGSPKFGDIAGELHKEAASHNEFVKAMDRVYEAYVPEGNPHGLNIESHKRKFLIWLHDKRDPWTKDGKVMSPGEIWNAAVIGIRGPTGPMRGTFANFFNGEGSGYAEWAETYLKAYKDWSEIKKCVIAYISKDVQYTPT
eukprot:139105_1